MVILRVVIAALAWAPFAAAQIVSPAPETVRVTIYRSNAEQSELENFEDDDEEPSMTGLVMVSETRSIDLPIGESTVVFHGVADAIVPQTAALENLGGIVLESNYQYDLLTPGAVLAHSHGERVRWVRTGPTGDVSDEEAIVRSGPEGVLLEVNGVLEALDCSGGAEKLVFPRVPSQLAPEPTLSMRVRTETAGRRTVRLSYLALGLDWKADYVATLNADNRTLDLTGWITLVNRSSTTFADTPAEVVAGELAYDAEETRPPERAPVEVQRHCWPVGSFSTALPPALRMNTPARPMLGMDDRSLSEIVVTAQKSTAPLAKLSELGDYKLYTLPHPTTVAARQSKQVRFLERTGVKYERVYVLTLDAEALESPDEYTPRAPSIVLRTENNKRVGLGVPLPAGRIAVMESYDAGQSLFAGLKRMQDTPTDLPIELAFAEASDVRIEPRLVKVTEPEDSDGRRGRAELEVRLTNGKPFATTLEYRHPITMEQIDASFEVMSASQKHEVEKGNYVWSFRLKPGAAKVLRYVVEAH